MPKPFAISLLTYPLLMPCILWFCGLHSPVHAKEWFVYVGTYTGARSQGIYVSQFNSDTGELSEPILAAETPSPSFLALRPSGTHLYAANELSSFEGKPNSGAISAFAVDSQTGKLRFLNSKPSQGAAPCHLVVDKTGKFVLFANYTGGNAGVMPIQADGSVGDTVSMVQHRGSSVNPQRQKEPHAHSINLDAENKFAMVADLGLDKLMVYRFSSATGQLIPHIPAFFQVAPGSGPRHFAFHPNGRWAYVINEITYTLTAMRFDPKAGVFTEIHTLSTLPPGVTQAGNSTAEVVVHPTGKFVYGSNRGHDSIALFKVHPRNGTLTWVENTPIRGKVPRNFAVDPTGRWLFAAGQSSDQVNLFKVDSKSGKLTSTGKSISVGSPVCLKFLPVGKAK